jgi:glutamate dehydrogenase
MIGDAEQSLVFSSLMDQLSATSQFKSPHALRNLLKAFFKDESDVTLQEKINFNLAVHLENYCAFIQSWDGKTPKIDVCTRQVHVEGVIYNRTIIHILINDHPFIVDSTLAMLAQMGKKIQYFMETDASVRRDQSGQLLDILGAQDHSENASREAFFRIELRGFSSEAEIEILKRKVEEVLEDVEVVVGDWLPMRHVMQQIIHDFSGRPEDTKEIQEFLAWVDDHHFTYLGYRWFGVKNLDNFSQEVLGLFKFPRWQSIVEKDRLLDFNENFILSNKYLWFSQTRQISSVHRTIPMHVLTIKKLNAQGEVEGVHQFVGLSSSVSYNRSPRDIPILRQKVTNILKASGFNPQGYSGKNLIQVLEHFPRDEFFQSSEAELLKVVTEVLDIDATKKVAVFVRPDVFSGMLSCLIFLAKDRYTPNLKDAFGRVLSQWLKGTIVSSESYLGGFLHARFHFLLAVEPSGKWNIEGLRQKIEQTSLSWSDRFLNQIAAHYSEEESHLFSIRYANAFPLSYQERFAVDEALIDLKKIEACYDFGLQTLVYLGPSPEGTQGIKVKLYNKGAPVPLAVVLPIFKNLDFDIAKDMPFKIQLTEAEEWVYVQDLEPMNSLGTISPEVVQDRFQEAFNLVWNKQIENDGFNRLLFRTNLSIWQIQLLRAYCKYIKQIGFNLSQHLIEETLLTYPQIAEDLVLLFEARFDPALSDVDRNNEVANLIEALEGRFESVTTLDQDRIIRKFYNLILSTVRTTAYQAYPDGSYKPYISFKFDCSLIEELPLPKPMYEIFVYSPRMEAVHLRGGKVARGGIRWSDRREDFRTEVLNLVKAQMIKNAVIVPVGSKGGFYVKSLPLGSIEDQKQEVIACYTMMISSMLDLTDNIIQGKVVTPNNVVAYDGEDPYLVVAADKGTATFSDIANGIAMEYGFWLSDAFASGGSSGYDHKKMGITARGAWESVRRHFREMNLSPDVDPFTVVGVGDMSGDIFGNGMLLSKQIRLLAAFNHQHIFIDPNPDLELSFQERKRLFELPSSTWLDYDLEAISVGGGVYSRQDKWIVVTDAMRSIMPISADVTRISPNDLIRCILTSPLDLMWFGGIGTFVKAIDETHADVGDRANDLVRVNVDEMLCKIIVEGANLGMTQQARIDFALKGGRINTDSLDNSGGVDCSDHEVNIKILLSDLMEQGRLTLQERNVLLASMTDVVGQLVLRDNYLQNLLITFKERFSPLQIESHALLIKRLEDEGVLNRSQSALPNESILAERMATLHGLTRPELIVLISHGKIWAYNQLLQSPFLKDEALGEDLLNYFPMTLQEKYPEEIARHPLRREIIATVIANEIINRFGCVILPRLDAASGRGVVNVIKALYVVIRLFNLRALWADLENLDPVMQTEQLIAILDKINRSIEKAAMWILQSDMIFEPVDIIEQQYKSLFKEILSSLNKVLGGKDANVFELEVRGLTHAHVPEKIAHKIVVINTIADSIFDIIQTTIETGHKVLETAKVHFYLSDTLGLKWAREALDQLALQNSWQKLSRSFLYADLLKHQAALVKKILLKEKGPFATPLESWQQSYAPEIERTMSLVREMQISPEIGMANIDILSRVLSNLTKE